MNRDQFQVRLKDGTRGTLDCYIFNDIPFNSESEMNQYLKTKTIKELEDWFRDNSGVIYELGQLISSLQRLKNDELLILTSLLTDLNELNKE